jgi:hypothetical protein
MCGWLKKNECIVVRDDRQTDHQRVTLKCDVPVNAMQAYEEVSVGVIYGCSGTKLDYKYPSYWIFVTVETYNSVLASNHKELPCTLNINQFNLPNIVISQFCIHWPRSVHTSSGVHPASFSKGSGGQSGWSVTPGSPLSNADVKAWS